MLLAEGAGHSSPALGLGCCPSLQHAPPPLRPTLVHTRVLGGLPLCKGAWRGLGDGVERAPWNTSAYLALVHGLLLLGHQRLCPPPVLCGPFSAGDAGDCACRRGRGWFWKGFVCTSILLCVYGRERAWHRGWGDSQGVHPSLVPAKSMLWLPRSHGRPCAGELPRAREAELSPTAGAQGGGTQCTDITQAGGSTRNGTQESCPHRPCMCQTGQTAGALGRTWSGPGTWGWVL